MIQVQTILNVADNSGVKKVYCIKVLGGSKKRYARLGDLIICSARSVFTTSKIKKGTVLKAVVVRVTKETRRADGSYIRFSDNSVVLINKNNDPLGTRIFGAIALELRKKDFSNIIAIAGEII